MPKGKLGGLGVAGRTFFGKRMQETADPPRPAIHANASGNFSSSVHSLSNLLLSPSASNSRALSNPVAQESTQESASLSTPFSQLR